MNGWRHGIPDEPKERQRIRGRLNDEERERFDAIIAKIDAQRLPNKEERRFLRQLVGQKKIPRPSKKFRGSDKKTHQDP